jgi:hypothetical protein
MARATRPISGQQASAWGPVFASEYDTKGGSRMKNLPSIKRKQVRKIAELSFDPESTADLPYLKATSKPNATKKMTTKSVTSEKGKSPTSSHSSVSGVTKAEF